MTTNMEKIKQLRSLENAGRGRGKNELMKEYVDRLFMRAVRLAGVVYLASMAGIIVYLVNQ